MADEVSTKEALAGWVLSVIVGTVFIKYIIFPLFDFERFPWIAIITAALIVFVHRVVPTFR
jgi:uncharacterized membrane protein required for colicin V production